MVEDESAGSLIYQLPLSAMPVLPGLVKWLEEFKEMSKHEEGKQVIRAWGVSQKSLEEAFLRL